MSNITLSDLTYISREDLSSEILAASDSSPLPPHIAVIDVRDSDHIGGHIKGSTWVPSSSLDYKTSELVRTLKDKEVVVFHCALSQQRGPSAALRYLREKQRLDPLGVALVAGNGGSASLGDKAVGQHAADGGDGKEVEKRQKVVVLEGGFTKWQEKFGEDGRLTEAYQKDVWEFGAY